MSNWKIFSKKTKVEKVTSDLQSSFFNQILQQRMTEVLGQTPKGQPMKPEPTPKKVYLVKDLMPDMKKAETKEGVAAIVMNDLKRNVMAPQQTFIVDNTIWQGIGAVQARTSLDR